MNWSTEHQRLFNIPEQLRNRDQWVTWQRTGNSKVPKHVTTGQNGDVTNPCTWGSFDDALEAMARYGHTGIGFVLTKSDPFVCIDLDHCLTNGTPNLAAVRLLSRFSSYSEVSVSGTGLHIFLHCDAAISGRKRLPDCEVYWQDRFIAMTGDVYGERGEIVDHTQAFSAWHRGFRVEEAPKVVVPQLAPDKRDPADLDRVVTELVAAHNTFRMLHCAGDLTMYGNDESRADLAYVQILVCAGITSPEDIRVAVGQSMLDRRKWDRPDYLERTVSAARLTSFAARTSVDGLADSDQSREAVLGSPAELEELESRRRTAVINTLSAQILANPNFGTGKTTALGLLVKFYAFEESGAVAPYRLSVAEIAEAAGLCRNTVTSHLKELEKQGLVTRTLKFEGPMLDPKTRQWSPPRTRHFIAPVGSARDFGQAAANLEQKRNHGGPRKHAFSRGFRPAQASAVADCSASGLAGATASQFGLPKGLVARVKNSRSHTSASTIS